VLHPFPGVVESDRVVGLEVAAPSGDGWPVSFPTFRDWRDASHSFVGIAAWTLVRVSVRERGEAESAGSRPIVAMSVSGNYFDLLGGRTIVGRGLRPNDENAHRAVATLAYAYWLRTYGGDQSVVGRTIYLNGDPFEIIGVAARDVVGTYTGVV